MDNYEKIIDKNNGIIYAYKLANYKMLWDIDDAIKLANEKYSFNLQNKEYYI